MVPTWATHRRFSMWLPPLRNPEFWVRILEVLKAIYELVKVLKSL
jgi:hypothetical protein